jgi:hypothetical protein
MRHSTLPVVVASIGIAVASWGCSGSDKASGPRQAERSTAFGSTAGAMTGGSAVAASTVPAGLQGLYQALPPAFRARFENLPEARQKAILARAAGMPPATLARLTRVFSHASTSRPVALNDAPDAVFKTNPPADGSGIIHGNAPFTVTFNECKTSDVDGDQAKYLYDFEGDGTFDRGSCRETHTYDAYAAVVETRHDTTVCVSDRQDEPGHEVCKTYQILVQRGGKGCKTVIVGSKITQQPVEVYETAFFDVLAGQGVKLSGSFDFAYGYGPQDYFGAVNYFDCGNFNGYVGAYNSGYGTYTSSYQPGASPGDYVGCYAEAYGGSTAPLAVSWKTQVCDPGSF